jgi:prolyl-tRNA editing enzyme YbaK/EbsC (Cys-tRNA(Pro) deacylase)
MTIEQLKESLSNQISEFEIIRHEKPIVSKKDAEGLFKIEETAPTLIISTDKGFYALIISGERNKVDFNVIKELLQCSNVNMANKTEIVEKFNIMPGQVPLVGHQLPCIMDQLLFNYPFVYGGSGDLYHTLKIKPEDLVKVNEVQLFFKT